MPFAPHAIGTLIVVVLKARNLPNKKHIGKQAPYCLVTLNEEKRRTKVIKRGGQHPEWDEEFRFNIYEDVESDLVRSVPGSNTPPPLPPKKKGLRKIKGGNFMKLQCYADDARDPDFIGEALVDLTEALTKGETDEWFTLMNKDKYAGEVYVELTFWSNEPPPEKKASRKPTISNKNYGGPGSFVSTDNVVGNGSTPPTARPMSASISQLDSLPSSLRASGSRPELYAPSYEKRNAGSPVDQVTNDFAELGMVDHRSRDNCATLRPSISSGYHSLPLPGSEPYEQQGQVEGSGFAYDNAITPTSHSRLSWSSSYYSTYENGSVSGHSSPARNPGPRHSLPSSPSGYAPISSAPTPSSYGSLSYTAAPSTFNVVQGRPSPPIPPAYSPHRAHPVYTSGSPTSSFTGPTAPVPPPSVTAHCISHSLSTSQIPDYHPYEMTPPDHEQAMPFPTHSAEYGSPLPPPTLVHSTPPQMYSARIPARSSPPSEIPAPLPALSFPSTGSRPLPQPGQFQRDRRYSVAAPPSSSFPQLGAGLPSSGSLPLALPVPPNYRRIPSAPGHPALPDPISSRPPPLPIPPSQVQVQENPPPRLPALPQPPVGYHAVQPSHQPLLPPPLPERPQHTPLPLTRSISTSIGNSHFQGSAQRPYSHYGQPLPTPPTVHGDWQ